MFRNLVEVPEFFCALLVIFRYKLYSFR